jgi:condensin complex subunit 2
MVAVAGGSRRLDDENAGRFRPPRPSTVGIQQSTMSFGRQRNRRRSSARFLQLHNRGGVIHEEAEVEEQTEDNNSGNLQELYKKVIRMNAENKINASNSWSLRLIENIDTFLEEDEENDSSEVEEEKEEDVNKENSGTLVPKRVNFTKASCTLDASVKIYSYRVDDVHLTSYKVLANLHRNSNKDDTARTQASNRDTHDQDEATGEQEEKGTEKTSGNAPTLEQNIGK